MMSLISFVVRSGLPQITTSSRSIARSGLSNGNMPMCRRRIVFFQCISDTKTRSEHVIFYGHSMIR